MRAHRLGKRQSTFPDHQLSCTSLMSDARLPRLAGRRPMSWFLLPIVRRLNHLAFDIICSTRNIQTHILFNSLQQRKHQNSSLCARKFPYLVRLCTYNFCVSKPILLVNIINQMMKDVQCLRRLFWVFKEAYWTKIQLHTKHTCWFIANSQI